MFFSLWKPVLIENNLTNFMLMSFYATQVSYKLLFIKNLLSHNPKIIISAKCF